MVRRKKEVKTSFFCFGEIFGTGNVEQNLFSKIFLQKS